MECVVAVGLASGTADCTEEQPDGPITGSEHDYTCGSTARRLVDQRDWIPMEVVQTASVEVPRLAVGGNFVYAAFSWWSDLKDAWGQAVVQIPIDRGVARQLSVVEGIAQPSVGLAATDDGVFFSIGPSAAGGEGSILYAPADGAAAQTLAPTNSGADALAADGSAVYFSDLSGTKSVPLGGGRVRAVAPIKSTSLMLSETVLYIVTGEGLFSWDVDGTSAPEALQLQAIQTSSCGADLCVTTLPVLDSSVVRRKGDKTTTTLAEHIHEPHSLAYDGSNLFTGAGGGGSSLLRVPERGGEPLTLMPAASSVAVASDCLYWTNDLGVFSWSTSAADSAQ